MIALAGNIPQLGRAQVAASILELDAGALRCTADFCRAIRMPDAVDHARRHVSNVFSGHHATALSWAGRNATSW